MEDLEDRDGSCAYLTLSIDRKLIAVLLRNPFVVVWDMAVFEAGGNEGCCSHCRALYTVEAEGGSSSRGVRARAMQTSMQSHLESQLVRLLIYV